MMVLSIRSYWKLSFSVVFCQIEAFALFCQIEASKKLVTLAADQTTRRWCTVVSSVQLKEK
jgi:hypothetical protein